MADGPDLATRMRTDAAFTARYELLDQLGAGAMGEVYKGRQHGLERLVAIKFLSPQFYEDADSMRRFRTEAEAMGRLVHPNIVQVHEFDGREDGPYIVLEFVEGESLNDRIERRGPMAFDEALETAAAMCRGLQAAHDAGVIHRDLKGDNVLLDGAGNPKLADFGLAKLTEGRGDQSRAGLIVGTPSTMSPEQCRGDPLDSRTDIYSLGIVLFEMLTGALPFDGENSMRIVLAHLNDPPPMLADLAGGVPFELEELVAGALKKEADDRYPTARAFEIAIGNAREALVARGMDLSRAAKPDPRGPPRAWDTARAGGMVPSPRAARPEGALDPLPEPPPPNRRGLVVAVVLAGLVAGIGLAGRGEPAPPPPPAADVAARSLERLVEEELFSGDYEEKPERLRDLLQHRVAVYLEDPVTREVAARALQEIFVRSGPDTLPRIHLESAMLLLECCGDRSVVTGLLASLSRGIFDRDEELPRIVGALQTALADVDAMPTDLRFEIQTALQLLLVEARATPTNGPFPGEARAHLLRIYLDLAAKDMRRAGFVPNYLFGAAPGPDALAATRPEAELVLRAAEEDAHLAQALLKVWSVAVSTHQEDFLAPPSLRVFDDAAMENLAAKHGLRTLSIRR